MKRVTVPWCAQNVELVRGVARVAPVQNMVSSQENAACGHAPGRPDDCKTELPWGVPGNDTEKGAYAIPYRSNRFRQTSQDTSY